MHGRVHLQLRNVQSAGAGSTFPVAWPASLVVQVVDDCGTSINEATVTASFTNGDPLQAQVAVDGCGRIDAGREHFGTGSGACKLFNQEIDFRALQARRDQNLHLTTSNAAKLPVNSPGSIRRKDPLLLNSSTECCTPG